MHVVADSSEFRIPDSELEGSVALRVPSQQSTRLVPLPSDKILFPRRMLYVEAVLYVTVAAAAFGLGYLAGRGGSTAPKNDDANSQVRGLDGKVMLAPRGGAKRGDEGAVVIVLPAERWPVKMISLDGLRPGDQGEARSAALAEFGGAAARANASGEFALSVPAAGSYRILVLSRQATCPPDVQLDPREISEIGKYFDAPAVLLQHCRYHWLTRDASRSSEPIEVEFAE